MSSKDTYVVQSNHELYQTTYFSYDKSVSSKTKEISYSEASSSKDKCPYQFISSEKEEIEFQDYYLESLNNEVNLINNHKDKFDHQFNKKSAKMFNFILAQGYKLRWQNKILCEIDSDFLKMVHLQEIKFSDCIWNIEFSLLFNRGINFNKKRLQLLLINGNIPQNNVKSYLLIFNSISSCTKLRKIVFDIHFNVFGETEISKSFYNYLSSCNLLKEIYLSYFVFYDKMNFSPFCSLISLNVLYLEFCSFHFNSFESLYINIFSNLKRLILFYNTIKNRLNNTYESSFNLSLKSITKFPAILQMQFHYEENSLENLLFQNLIQVKGITMKNLDLHIHGFKSDQILCLSKFLKCSKIQFITLGLLNLNEGFDNQTFLDFLRNSDYLQGLELISSINSNKKQIKLNLILQELSHNQTIKILYFRNMNLSHFYSDFVYFISKNQTISTLVVWDNDLVIDKSFIEVVVKSKSILYLILSCSKIEEECAIQLCESNLKGINIDCLEIKESSKDLIYKSIPRIEYFDDLVDSEKLLSK